MLGRGKRTAFLTIRASSIGLPKIAEISGPFWTNVNDESEFTRVLDFTIDSSSDQWSQAVSRYVPTVMSFDPDNSRLFAILEELGVSHGKGIAEVRRRARDTYGV
jgi:surface carbohydrate biosynthesis protein